VNAASPGGRLRVSQGAGFTLSVARPSRARCLSAGARGSLVRVPVLLAQWPRGTPSRGLSGAEAAAHTPVVGDVSPHRKPEVLSRFRTFSRVSMVSCVTEPCRYRASAALPGLRAAVDPRAANAGPDQVHNLDMAAVRPRSVVFAARVTPRASAGGCVCASDRTKRRQARSRGLGATTGIGQPRWPRSMLSHAAHTSATTARPGRVSAGLASTGRQGALALLRRRSGPLAAQPEAMRGGHTRPDDCRD
jgi:hypothetical protein